MQIPYPAGFLEQLQMFTHQCVLNMFGTPPYTSGSATKENYCTERDQEFKRHKLLVSEKEQVEGKSKPEDKELLSKYQYHLKKQTEYIENSTSHQLNHI